MLRYQKCCCIGMRENYKLQFKEILYVLTSHLDFGTSSSTLNIVSIFNQKSTGNTIHRLLHLSMFLALRVRSYEQYHLCSLFIVHPSSSSSSICHKFRYVRFSYCLKTENTHSQPSNLSKPINSY